MGATAISGNLRRVGMVSIIAALLLIPALAMQFTREVNWTSLDFVAAAVLLGGAALVYELAVARIARRTQRRIAVAALVGLLLVVWAQGAVGIV